MTANQRIIGKVHEALDCTAHKPEYQAIWEHLAWLLEAALSHGSQVEKETSSKGKGYHCEAYYRLLMALEVIANTILNARTDEAELPLAQLINSIPLDNMEGEAC